MPAELAYLRRLDKVPVHQDFVSTQRDFALKASVLHDVLGIGASGQSADASVLRQISERNIQAEIFAGKLKRMLKNEIQQM